MESAVWSFSILLILITAAGAFAWVRKRKTTGDYLVASREVKPWLSALSAVATNNSGFMFIGMIAFSYRVGIESIWMAVGWILGDLTAWLFVHPRVREHSGRMKAKTLSGVIGMSDGNENRVLIVLAGLITFVFLGIYSAGQFKAGSLALHALFGWDMWVGILIAMVVVILYSFAGGIRATIWTDAAQSLVMIGSMAMILIMSWRTIGGPSALFDNLRQQDPALMSLFPANLEFGVLFYLLGMMSGGFGSMGQPQIMVRFMAIESVEAIKRARVWYFTWFVPFFAASVGVGLYSRAILPDLPNLEVAEGVTEPTELALPLMTMEMLPEVFVGISLAGLFAATMSTADSQVIVCSGSVTQDIRPKWKDSYIASKVATVSVALLALAVALFAPEGVFGLVLIAWSALAASLGSVMLLRIFRQPFSTTTAVVMMLTGFGTVVAWHLSAFNDDVFKLLPGLAAAFLVYLVSRLFAKFTSRGTHS
ncbi:MAG: sodium/proline symporter [Marinobacter sp.]|uniref:sodium/proline symporter n=1 Tax=Marinobacter sp. TaxID=50741 RepID=UPI00299E8E85|nr:sodium/proline symporter [Marinobacter sp.]MDX1635229.1 sodium/proline symporter [Marinobacter sp.]